MSVVISFLVTLVLIPVVIRSGIMDKPNYRSIHHKEIPKAGGIAILFGVLAGMFFSGFGSEYPFLSLLLIGSALLGLVDDLKNLSPKLKMLGQLLLAAGAVAIGYEFRLFGGFADSLLTAIWLIGFMNAFNLIDGMDGLAAGVALISSGAFLLLGIADLTSSLLPLIGSLAAFLVYNFKPAKIFMGDTGSMFLGYFLGITGVTVQSSADSEILGSAAFILILFYPVFDTFLSIIRRKANKKPILEPDRSHSYNLLVDQLGLGYLATIFIIYLLSALLGGLGIWVYHSASYLWAIAALSVIIGLLIFLVQHFNLLAESAYERGSRD